MPLRTPPALLFVVSGPAGSGKTTLCDRLVETSPNIQRVVTSTSRAPRGAERDGVDYYFFGEDDFRRRIAAGEFYEYAQVHGRYYGSLRSEIQTKLARNIDLLLNIDVQGAASMREAARTDPALRGRLVTIFIHPLDREQLRERLTGRATDALAEIERRLVTAELEMRQWDRFDYCIVSRTKDEDYARIRAIYDAEKLRVRPPQP